MRVRLYIAYDSFRSGSAVLNLELCLPAQFSRDLILSINSQLLRSSYKNRSYLSTRMILRVEIGLCFIFLSSFFFFLSYLLRSYNYTFANILTYFFTGVSIDITLTYSS